MAVAAGLDEADQQRGEVLGALLGVGGGVGHLHLGDAGELGGGLGGGGAAAAGNQHFDVGAEPGGGADGVEGGGLEAGVVVFGNDEDGHVFCLRISWAHCKGVGAM